MRFKTDFENYNTDNRQLSEDVRQMWVYMIGQIGDENLKSKIKANTKFQPAYLKHDIGTLWEIMNDEAINGGISVSKAMLYDKLLGIKQGNSSFNTYALQYTDAIAEFTKFDKRPDEDFLIQQFLRSLDSIENESWIKHYSTLPDGSMNKPVKIEKLIQNINEYNAKLISYNVRDSNYNNLKQNTTLTANTAQVKPPITLSKNNRICWNCDSNDCIARGGRCKIKESVYCKTCNGAHWHQTKHHDAWTLQQQKYNNNKQTRNSTASAQPYWPPQNPAAINGYAAYIHNLQLAQQQQFHPTPYQQILNNNMPTQQMYMSNYTADMQQLNDINEFTDIADNTTNN
jgi:hypothetical protein